MILVTKPLIKRDKEDTLSLLVQCVCVCVCIFIKLHITAQSGPVIVVILCHSH